MATKNDITGDSIVSKKNSKAYQDNWELIFGNKKPLESFSEIEIDGKKVDLSNHKIIKDEK